MQSIKDLDALKYYAGIIVLYNDADAKKHIDYVMRLYNNVKQDLEHKEKLENRLKEIETNYNYIQLGKLEKVIEILKRNIVIEFNDDLRYIHLKETVSQSYDYTIIDIEDQQEYELLKEMLGNENKNI